MGGLKTFIPPQIVGVCVWGGLKTETGKFLLHFQNSKSSNRCWSVFIPPPELLVYVFLGGGLKTETGKFLLHFQNSKSSNRCRSVYGTDIIIDVLQQCVLQLKSRTFCWCHDERISLWHSYDKTTIKMRSVFKHNNATFPVPINRTGFSLKRLKCEHFIERYTLKYKIFTKILYMTLTSSTEKLLHK